MKSISDNIIRLKLLKHFNYCSFTIFVSRIHIHVEVDDAFVGSGFQDGSACFGASVSGLELLNSCLQLGNVLNVLFDGVLVLLVLFHEGSKLDLELLHGGGKLKDRVRHVSILRNVEAEP